MCSVTQQYSGAIRSLTFRISGHVQWNIGGNGVKFCMEIDDGVYFYVKCLFNNNNNNNNNNAVICFCYIYKLMVFKCDSKNNLRV
jgi:hypothetical protein